MSSVASPYATTSPSYIDHVALALSRLCEQFKNSPNIVALLTAVMGVVQDVENALSQLLVNRALATATGVQLDTIGSLVGQPRSGLSDTDYRRICGARIAAHRASGTTEELVDIASTVVNNPACKINLHTYWDASAILEITGVAVTQSTADLVTQLVRLAHGGGVRTVVQYSLSAPASTFTLDVGPGLDVGALEAQEE